MIRTCLHLLITLLLLISVGCKNDAQSPSERQTTEINQPQEDSVQESPTSEPDKERNLSDLIQVETSLENITIESPLHIKGKARGMWYFEGDFPIYLVSEEREKLAVAIAVGEGDWMTTDWVEFSATLEFDLQEPGEGYLIFEKSNPSDNRELDRELQIPVSF